MFEKYVAPSGLLLMEENFIFTLENNDPNILHLKFSSLEQQKVSGVLKIWFGRHQYNLIKPLWISEHLNDFLKT